MNRRLERVNVASLRVALIGMGVVAVVYALVAVLVVMFVTNDLTAQVDTRLTAQLAHYQQQPLLRLPFASVTDSGQGDFGAPLLIWAIDPSGIQPTQTNIQPPVELPAQDANVTTPITTSLHGADLRIAGGPVGSYHLVVGYNVDSVTQARSSLVAIETAVGIIILLLVFFGTLFVGRRVGAPIELARQRQLEFTADASHELRTPLAVIEAQTSLALNQDRDPAWYRNAFQRVGSESKRIRRLVDDLLWLARVDTPEGRPASEPVEVGVVVSQAGERFAAVAESRGITLQVSVGLGPLVVMGSSEWLDRLLGVLLDNAFKYAPEGGVVAVNVGADGNRVRLVVEDSGPGIPDEERPKIFDRFHRAEAQGGYGSGLGLAIADAVVRHTHGRWEVSTSELGGARMAVSWARVLSSSKDQGEADPAVSWTVPAPARPSVKA
ncbi:MAG: HAMP domain-containing sensor histidine kinase [Candidatus Dormiibacterota bacterium]